MKKYIETYIRKHLQVEDLTHLKNIYDSVSKIYRQNQSPPVMSRRQVLAYILARFPATSSVCKEVLSQLNYLRPTPHSLLEVGSGPGTGTFAGLELFQSLKNLTLLEKEKDFLSVSQEILLSVQKDRPLEVTYLHQSYDSHLALPSHDLVISSYFLNELPSASLRRVVETLWASTGQYLIIIEPGTPVGFNIVRQAREILINQEAVIIGPCTHNNPCPMSGSDWCHFSVRLQRDKLHQSLKGTLPYEDEKYSYIIATKMQVSPKTSARIIKKTFHRTGHLVLPLCTQNGLESLTLTKNKDKELYKTARHLGWGQGWSNKKM